MATTTSNFDWPIPESTDLVKDGATAIAALGNAIDSSLVEDYAAGKNKIINGDFFINQRGFTSTTTSNVYTFDRWLTFVTGDGTGTYTPQTFTPGTAPVAGYEGANFYRVVTASQTSTAVRTAFRQRVENVRTFAGQTVTVSFWAKADSGTPKIGLAMQRVYGSGGSPSATEYITPATPITITTSWARYSITISVPSLSGKTLGTDPNTSSLAIVLPVSVGSDFTSELGSVGIQNNTFDIWGVQAEAGSVATAFQTATGTLQGELAACQRYYIRTKSDQLSSNYGLGFGNSSTQIFFQVQTPEMRTTPTVADYANLEASDGSASVALTSLAINSANSTARVAFLSCFAASGVTQYRPYLLRNNANTAGYLGLGAEL